MKVNIKYFKGNLYSQQISLIQDCVDVLSLLIGESLGELYIEADDQLAPLEVPLNGTQRVIISDGHALPGDHYFAVLVDYLIESKLQGLVLYGLEFDWLRSEGVQQRDVVKVDKIIPLSLEFLVGCQGKLDDQVSCFLGESDVALTGESDFFSTRLSSHTWLNFDDSGNRDDSLISSVINSFNLVKLNLFLASKEELLECAVHGDFKVLGGILLGDTDILRNELKGRDLISKGINGDREWVACTEEFLKNLIDVTRESIAALYH
jgi:hypothetical protein